MLERVEMFEQVRELQASTFISSCIISEPLCVSAQKGKHDRNLIRRAIDRRQAAQ